MVSQFRSHCVCEWVDPLLLHWQYWKSEYYDSTSQALVHAEKIHRTTVLERHACTRGEFEACDKRGSVAVLLVYLPPCVSFQGVPLPSPAGNSSPATAAVGWSWTGLANTTAPCLSPRRSRRQRRYCNIYVYNILWSTGPQTNGWWLFWFVADAVRGAWWYYVHDYTHAQTKTRMLVGLVMQLRHCVCWFRWTK